MGFLETYMQWVGKTTTPDRWNLWSAIAIMGAALQDRVWTESRIGRPLYPTMYIMLLGEAGLGKNEAIDMACSIAKCDSRINIAEGCFTKQALIDLFESDQGKTPIAADLEDRLDIRSPMCKQWMTMPELSYSIGDGERAREFVKTVTETFSNRHIIDSTRSHGRRGSLEVNLNWLFGTNEKWLRDCIRSEDLTGGFSSRVYTILEKKDYTRREADNWRPENYRDLEPVLHQFVSIMCNAEGMVARSPEAVAYVDHWDRTREPPVIQEFGGHWSRQPMHIWKLALVHSFNRKPTYVIELEDVKWAMAQIERIYQDLPVLLKLSSGTYSSTILEKVENCIREITKSTVTPFLYSTLTKKLRNRNILPTQVRACIKEMLNNGALEVVATPGKGDYYRLMEGDI